MDTSEAHEGSGQVMNTGNVSGSPDEVEPRPDPKALRPSFRLALMFAVALARRIGASRAPRLIRNYAAAPPSGLSEGERTIFQKLTEKFSPAELQVQDVSGM